MHAQAQIELTQQEADALEVFRSGIAPCLTVSELMRLREGLAGADIHLLQGYTTDPPEHRVVSTTPMRGGDPLVYGAWREGALPTVGEGVAYWKQVLDDAATVLGEPSAVNAWLNWWDRADRLRAFELLLGVVGRAIERRMMEEEGV